MSTKAKPLPRNPASNRLAEEDFYLNEAGLMVFTAIYHQKRGYCCKSGCRHCPYGFRNTEVGG